MEAKLKFKIYSLMIGLLLYACLAKGEEGLSLEQALEMAARQNPEILAAKKALAVSSGKKLQMEAIAEPEIVFSAEGLSTGISGASGGEKEISFGIQQYLEFPKKRSLRGKIGSYEEEIARLELERTMIRIKARVKRAYYKALFSQKTVAALESSSKQLEEFIEMANIKYQLGAVPYLDVLRARVEKARLQNQWIEASKEWKLDKSSLNLLLGKRGEESLSLLTDISFLPFGQNLPEIKEQAKQTKPSLSIASLRIERAGAGLRLSRMSYFPDFSIGLFFPSLRSRAWGVAVGFSVPLYWWKRQKGEILEAQAVEELNLISSDSTERRIMAEIENAYSGVKAAEDQVKVFEEKLLREVEEQLKAGLNSYQYGKIDSLNLLDLYRTYTLTKLEYLKSLFLYLVSLADLEAAGEEGE
jgi:cobalt-zinc-cadmium efflux system outer membrane protein